MERVAAVLLDLDDTLLDAGAAWRSGIGRMLQRAPGVAFDDALAAWGEVFPRWFDQYLAGAITLERSRAGRVRDWADLLGVEVPRGAELDWFASFTDGYEQGWVAFPDVTDALARLAGTGIAVGIVTNGDGAQQRQKVTALALDAVVSVVVVSSDVGAAKPDPLVFRTAARALGVPDAQCVVVGDQLDTDIAGALACRMRAVWLRRPGTRAAATAAPQDLRITTIESLAALPDLLGLPGEAGLSPVDGPGLP